MRAGGVHSFPNLGATLRVPLARPLIECREVLICVGSAELPQGEVCLATP